MRTVKGKTFRLLGVREGMAADQFVPQRHAQLAIPQVTDTGLPVAIEEDCDCDAHRSQDQGVDFQPVGAGYADAGYAMDDSARHDEDYDDEDDDEDDDDEDEDEDDEDEARLAAVQRPQALGRVRRDDVHRVVAAGAGPGRDADGQWNPYRDAYRNAGLQTSDVQVEDKLANARVRSYGVALYQSQYARTEAMDVTEVHPRRAVRDARSASRVDAPAGRHGDPVGPDRYRGRHRYFRG